MPLIPTLFPAPVVPATRRCGIRTRSATTGSPWTSRPSAIVRSDGDFRKRSLSMTSRSAMTSRFRFGTSMPTAARPGILSIRTFSAARARARSFSRFETCATFTPAEGLNSYVVTTGPGVKVSTIPSTSNSRHFEAISSIVCRNSSRSRSRSRFGAARRRRSGGKIQPFDSFGDGNGRMRCGASDFFSCAGRATGRGGSGASPAPVTVFWMEKRPVPAFSRTRSVATDGMKTTSPSGSGFAFSAGRAASSFARSRCFFTTSRRSDSLSACSFRRCRSSTPAAPPAGEPQRRPAGAVAERNRRREERADEEERRRGGSRRPAR